MKPVMEVLGFDDRLMTLYNNKVMEHSPKLIDYVTQESDVERRISWYVKLSSLSSETQEVIRKEINEELGKELELKDRNYTVERKKKSWFSL